MGDFSFLSAYKYFQLNLFIGAGRVDGGELSPQKAPGPFLLVPLVSASHSSFGSLTLKLWTCVNTGEEQTCCLPTVPLAVCVCYASGFLKILLRL